MFLNIICFICDSKSWRNTQNIRTGVIKNPPPIPNNPDKKPTQKLKNKISKILTELEQLVGKKSIQLTKKFDINLVNRDIYLLIINLSGIIQLMDIFMSKKCELTGIKPIKGHNVSHANNKTKRSFLPSLKK